MIKVENQVRLDLEKIYQDINFNLFLESEDKKFFDKINHFCISVYDRWLNEKESENIVTYNMVNLSQEEENKYMELEKRILSFFSLIKRHFGVYIPSSEKFEINEFYYPHTEEDYIFYLRDIIRNEKRALFLIPSIKSVLVTGFDLTYPFFSLQPNIEETIFPLILESKLHVLESD